MQEWPEGWQKVRCERCGEIIGGYHEDNQPTILEIGCGSCGQFNAVRA